MDQKVLRAFDHIKRQKKAVNKNRLWRIMKENASKKDIHASLEHLLNTKVIEKVVYVNGQSDSQIY